MLAIAGGIILAFLIIRLIIRNDGRRKQREIKFSELLARFLTKPITAEEVSAGSLSHDSMVKQFATWLATKEGSVALAESSYQLAAAVQDFKWFIKRHGLEPPVPRPMKMNRYEQAPALVNRHQPTPAVSSTRLVIFVTFAAALTLSGPYLFFMAALHAESGIRLAAAFGIAAVFTFTMGCVGLYFDFRDLIRGWSRSRAPKRCE
jgi:hypothetical protein